MANSSGFLYGNALQQCSQSVRKTCRMTCSPKNGAWSARCRASTVGCSCSCIVVKRSTSLQHFEFRRSAVSHFPLQKNTSFCNPNVLFHQDVKSILPKNNKLPNVFHATLKKIQKITIRIPFSPAPPPKKKNLPNLPMFFCFATLMAPWLFGSPPAKLISESHRRWWIRWCGCSSRRWVVRPPPRAATRGFKQPSYMRVT